MVVTVMRLFISCFLIISFGGIVHGQDVTSDSPVGPASVFAEQETSLIPLPEDVLEGNEEDKFEAVGLKRSSESEFNKEFRQEQQTQSEISNEQEQRQRIGGGMSLSPLSYFFGVIAFYEFKLDSSSPYNLRAQTVYDFATVTGEGTSMGITRLFIDAKVEIPLETIKHSYVGFGGGYGQNTLSYNNINTGQSYSANGGGLYAIGEIGYDKYWDWQETRQVALNVGLDLGFYLVYNDDYDENRISNVTNHRTIVNEAWSAAQQIIRLNVSFGGTF